MDFHMKIVVSDILKWSVTRFEPRSDRYTVTRKQYGVSFFWMLASLLVVCFS